MNINHLHIYTADLEKQVRFYRDTLGLSVVEIADSKAEVEIGYSVLVLEESREFKPYHIAFHISDKKEQQGLEWLQERVELLKFKDDAIIDFSSWDARSLYFYDADHNVLEFISRRNLFPTEESGFSENEIKGIAEIGLAVENVRETYIQIYQETNLEQFDGDLKNFCPIGDHSGLLITVDQHDKTWFPTEDPSRNASFSVDFQHNNQRYNLCYDGDQLRIASLKK